MPPEQHTRHRGKLRRRVAITAATIAAALVALWFTLTSSAALVPERAAPNAMEVAAGRDAYRQLRNAKGNEAGVWVVLGPLQLSGVDALASHGFRPDRLQIATQGSDLQVKGSHRLPLGRWLNFTLAARSPSSNFPEMRLKIGRLALPPRLSRLALETGRWLLHLKHSDVPQLDGAVRNFSVRNGRVAALISLPGKSGLIDQMAGMIARPVDREAVLRIYCALSRREEQRPSGDFAEHVRRAFSMDREGTPQPDFNAAAFVALGMLLVDERVGDFAQLTPADLGSCRLPAVQAAIYSRADWTKHWSLSAALVVGAGTQLSEAAGEWKELSDSLARQSQSAVADPSGFSMVDLAADRAGFQAAQAAIQASNAERLARQLAKVTPEQLLPHGLTEREDGLTNKQFVELYGSLDDPRFKVRVRQIDEALGRTALR